MPVEQWFKQSGATPWTGNAQATFAATGQPVPSRFTMPDYNPNLMMQQMQRGSMSPPPMGTAGPAQVGNLAHLSRANASSTFSVTRPSCPVPQLRLDLLQHLVTFWSNLCNCNFRCQQDQSDRCLTVGLPTAATANVFDRPPFYPFSSAGSANGEKRQILLSHTQMFVPVMSVVFCVRLLVSESIYWSVAVLDSCLCLCVAAWVPITPVPLFRGCLGSAASVLIKKSNLQDAS